MQLLHQHGSCVLRGFGNSCVRCSHDRSQKATCITTVTHLTTWASKCRVSTVFVPPSMPVCCNLSAVLIPPNPWRDNQADAHDAGCDGSVRDLCVCVSSGYSRLQLLRLRTHGRHLYMWGPPHDPWQLLLRTHINQLLLSSTHNGERSISLLARKQPFHFSIYTGHQRRR